VRNRLAPYSPFAAPAAGHHRYARGPDRSCLQARSACLTLQPTLVRTRSHRMRGTSERVFSVELSAYASTAVRTVIRGNSATPAREDVRRATARATPTRIR
jgi:hypothetical protein